MFSAGIDSIESPAATSAIRRNPTRVIRGACPPKFALRNDVFIRPRASPSAAVYLYRKKLLQGTGRHQEELKLLPLRCLRGQKESSSFKMPNRRIFTDVSTARLRLLFASNAGAAIAKSGGLLQRAERRPFLTPPALHDTDRFVDASRRCGCDQLRVKQFGHSMTFTKPKPSHRRVYRLRVAVV